MFKEIYTFPLSYTTFGVVARKPVVWELQRKVLEKLDIK
jgi:hypothetical protein